MGIYEEISSAINLQELGIDNLGKSAVTLMQLDDVISEVGILVEMHTTQPSYYSALPVEQQVIESAQVIMVNQVPNSEPVTDIRFNLNPATRHNIGVLWRQVEADFNHDLSEVVHGRAESILSSGLHGALRRIAGIILSTDHYNVYQTERMHKVAIPMRAKVKSLYSNLTQVRDFRQQLSVWGETGELMHSQLGLHSQLTQELIKLQSTFLSWYSATEVTRIVDFLQQRKIETQVQLWQLAAQNLQSNSDK